MRGTLVTMLLLPGLLFAVTPAGSEESEAADATPTAATKAVEEEEFTLPPGFRAKKRGKFILYCRKEDVIGTRFQAEKCYDENGIRELLAAQRDQQSKLDQMRRICGQTGACGGT